jgi:membrane protease subunit HflC
MVTYQVSFTERVVVTTFGKPLEQPELVVDEVGPDAAALARVLQPSVDDVEGLLRDLPAEVRGDWSVEQAHSILEQVQAAGAQARLRQFAGTPGWHLKWPWPIQRVLRYDGRLQMLEDTEEETLTKDGKNIVVVTYCSWQVDDALTFSKRVRKFSQAADSMIKLIRAAKTAVIADYELNDFVSLDREGLQQRYDQMEGEILGRVGRQARTEYGIQVVSLGIKRISLPKTVSQKVFEQMRETRNKQADTTRAEGNAEAERIRARAQSAKRRILAFAQRLADQIKSKGDAAAAEYYDVFRENPEFAEFLKQMDFLRETLKQDTTFLMDYKTPPFNYFQDDQNVLSTVLGSTTQPAELSSPMPVLGGATK